jgi:hypothetical protein
VVRQDVLGERDAAVLLTELAVAVERTTVLLRTANDLHRQLADVLGTQVGYLVDLEQRLRDARGDDPSGA